MSNTAKIVVGIIVILAIIGIWQLSRSSSDNQSPTATSTDITSQTDQNNGQTSQVSPAASNGISANDSSDAAITSDMTKIDTQMSGLNSDNASADKGLNSANQ